MKKKLLLIISILAVAFMFAGCGSEESELFTYDADEMAQYALYLSSGYISTVADSVNYNYYTEHSDTAGLTDADVDALEVFSKLESDYGEFGEFTGEYDIEELEDSVQVTLYADCADSDIVVKVTMEDNSSEYNYYIKSYMSYYSCTEDEAASTLKSSGCYPYKATEFEISADQTKAELMKSAGVNTLIGMGTVFIVLIFISFIISLLRFVPGLVGLFTKEGRASRKAAKETVTVSNDTKSDDIKEEAAPAQKIVSVTNAATGASAMDDGQLVAVIAAAVNAYAADGQQTYVNYPSNDKLIVRSFRRK